MIDVQSLASTIEFKMTELKSVTFFSHNYAFLNIQFI
jgi:hypothetical protein